MRIMHHVAGLLLLPVLITGSCSNGTAEGGAARGGNGGVQVASARAAGEAVRAAEQQLPRALQCLVDAYPAFVTRQKDGSVRLADGRVLRAADLGGVPDVGAMSRADYEKVLEGGDLALQLSMGVLYDTTYLGSRRNWDPARLRNEEFFAMMYGRSSAEVRAKLVPITWMPGVFNHTVRITSVNNVHKKLEAVSRELAALPAHLHKYCAPIGGTFNYRAVRGSTRRSAHAYGIAIDLNTKYSDYWLWKGGKTGEVRYANRLPLEIVRVFERHGFVWGGRWYHYDTMHFEYRPEALCVR